MRNRSIAGPLILILVGFVFLFRNFIPSFPIWELAQYWPFLLIGLGAIRLIEVLLAWRSGAPVGPVPGDRAGYRPRTMGFGQILGLIVLCLVIAGITRHASRDHFFRISSGGMELFGDHFEYPVSATAPAGGAKRLVLDNLRGNVTISGGDGAEVRVEGHKSVTAYNKSEADLADRRTNVVVRQEGDRVLLGFEESGAPADSKVSADLDITVPRGMSVESRGRQGDLAVNTITGDVDVSSQRGEVRLTGIGGSARVDLSRSGLVRATDVTGNLDIQGKGSDVQLENIKGLVTIAGSYSGTLEFRNLEQPLHFESDRTDLRIARIPGTVTMELGDFRANNIIGPARLVTKSRDIHLEDFTESLELKIERGDIELNPGKTIPKMDVHARNGDIQLRLPEHADFDLNATTVQGEVHNDYGDRLVTSGSDGRNAAVRSINGKGPLITVATERGTISIEKN